MKRAVLPKAGSPVPRRLIAVNRFFWPDHAPTSQILGDLVFDLSARGWPVTVIASRQRYGDAAARLSAHESARGVAVRRVWTSRLGTGSLAGRALDYLTFYASATCALLAEARRGDVILVKTDPPLTSIPVALVARLKGARLVTWNHDLFPEVAAALGVTWAGGTLGRMLGRLRDASLRAADLNVAISPGMAESIARAGVAPERLRVIRNWSACEIRPVAAETNPLRAEWGLGGAFVIGYSGNLGRAHMAGHVAELVRRTHDLPGLAWLFVGGGSGQARIREAVAATGATNVHFQPYQPRAELSCSLAVPDLHLVTLAPACEDLMMPSKLAGVMAARRPALFLGNPAGAVAREIARHGMGIALDPDRPETWRAQVAALRARPDVLGAMGARAGAAGAAEFAPERLIGAWRGAIAAAAGPESVRPAPAPVGGAVGRLARRLRSSGTGVIVARGTFMALAGAATVLALYPQLNLGGLQALKDATEPLAHLLTFAALTVIGALGWRPSLPLILGLAGLAVSLELGQFLAQGRDPYLAQVLAGVAGVTLGSLIARPWWSHRGRPTRWRGAGEPGGQ